MDGGGHVVDAAPRRSAVGYSSSRLLSGAVDVESRLVLMSHHNKHRGEMKRHKLAHGWHTVSRRECGISMTIHPRNSTARINTDNNVSSAEFVTTTHYGAVCIAFAPVDPMACPGARKKDDAHAGWEKITDVNGIMVDAEWDT